MEICDLQRARELLISSLPFIPLLIYILLFSMFITYFLSFIKTKSKGILLKNLSRISYFGLVKLKITVTVKLCKSKKDNANVSSSFEFNASKNNTEFHTNIFKYRNLYKDFFVLYSLKFFSFIFHWLIYSLIYYY